MYVNVVVGFPSNGTSVVVELYRQTTDHGRRLLNQTLFEELLIDQDREEPHITITGQTYSEPVAELMTAAHGPGTNDGRPAASGEPSVLVSLANSPTPVPQDKGWNKAAMVELRRFELLTPSMPWRCATSCATAPPLLQQSACAARR